MSTSQENALYSQTVVTIIKNNMELKPLVLPADTVYNLLVSVISICLLTTSLNKGAW